MRCIAIAAAGLVLAASAPAPGQGPAVVPAALEPLALPDQHGEARAVDASVRILVLSRDMDGGAVVRAALEAQGDAAGEFLSARGAVYVADVSRMPGLVRRLLAVPRMRSRPYSVLLDTTGDATRAEPRPHLPGGRRAGGW